MRTRLATIVMIAAGAAAALPALSLISAPASATNEGQVCTGLDSGKIDTTGDPQSVTVSAPAGKVIVSYCVKAGSEHHGNGPVYVTLVEPVTSLVIRHPSGKAVSHYSVAYEATTPTEPTPTEPTPTEPTPTEPTPTEPTPTEPTPTEPTPTEPTGPFDWNWEYDEPTCDALTVVYPADLPSGQANDVNIRLETDHGQVTLNYHNNEGTWSGTTGFTYSQHRNWPVGVTDYTVTWVQVGGSNYHWQGHVSCRITADGDATTLDAPRGVTEIEGWRTGTVTIAKGTAASADSVLVEQPGLANLELQRFSQGTWQPVRTVATSDNGTARVTFPRQSRRGTYAYRLAVTGTESVTGTVSSRFTVRVR